MVKDSNYNGYLMIDIKSLYEDYSQEIKLINIVTNFLIFGTIGLFIYSIYSSSSSEKKDKNLLLKLITLSLQLWYSIFPFLLPFFFILSISFILQERTVVNIVLIILNSLACSTYISIELISLRLLNLTIPHANMPTIRFNENFDLLKLPLRITLISMLMIKELTSVSYELICMLSGLVVGLMVS